MTAPLARPAPTASSAPEWLAVLGLVWVVALLATHLMREGDTSVLVNNADGLLRCFREGRAWASCPEGGQWPPYQLVIAVPLRALGWDQARVLDALAWTSLAAFVGLLAMLWRTLSLRSRPLAAVALLVMGCGPLVHYASSSFTEMGAAFLIATFAALWLQGSNPVWIGAVALFAGLTKETAFPFLALLGAVCVAVRRSRSPVEQRGWRQVLSAERARLIGAAVGLAVAVGLAWTLNFYRFGVPYSLPYVQQTKWAAPLTTQPMYLIAQWIAPNAGLLFFWPLLTALLFAIAAKVVLARRRSGRAVDVLPLAGVALLLLGVCAGLAHWWATFGWWAWGSRLTYPWMPVALLVLLFAYAEQAEALVRPLVAARWRTALLALLVAWLSVPHVLTHPFYGDLITHHFVSHGVCPLPEGSNYSVFWTCVDFLTWSMESPLVRAWQMLLRGDGWTWATPLALTLACGCAALFRLSSAAKERA